MLIKLLEAVGVLGPRGCCSKCQAVPQDGQLRERARTVPYEGPGGLPVSLNVPLLTWRCRPCDTECPVLRSCEVANTQWTLLQNANLLYSWCQQQEPSANQLAADAHVDASQAARTFQQPLRALIAEEQAIVQSVVQLGGVGVDVEMDEVNFRTQRLVVDGETTYRVQRYLCAAERASRKMVLLALPEKFVKVGSRTGSIRNEELYAAMFPAGRPPLLLPGTVVHTDSAKAYRNLGWQGAPSTAEVPLDVARQSVAAPWTHGLGPTGPRRPRPPPRGPCTDPDPPSRQPLRRRPQTAPPLHNHGPCGGPNPRRPAPAAPLRRRPASPNGPRGAPAG